MRLSTVFWLIFPDAFIFLDLYAKICYNKEYEMCRKKIHIRQNETIERKRQMNEKDIWKLVLAGLGENHNLSPMTVNLWFDTMSMEKLTPEAAFFRTDND